MAVKKKKTNEDVTTDVVVVEQVSDHKPMIRDADILNMDYSFDDKIEVATKVAASLKNVIQSQDLAVKIGPSEYVTAEGWEVLGTMLGCTPYVESVEEIPTDHKHKFMYKATVSIRQGDTILSRASAMAERNNMQKDRPSVYWLCLGLLRWLIMNLLLQRKCQGSDKNHLAVLRMTCKEQKRTL